MKKFILVLALASLFSIPAMANPDSDSCGLGWQVTQKKSFLGTTTRGTTNAFVPPTFGMTTGTMGCAQHSFAQKDVKAVEYVVSNYEPLTIEMAEGRGEYVEGLAQAMGCDASAYEAFGRMTQQQYQAIMPGKTAPAQLFKNVQEQVKRTPALAGRCNA